jgi:hypothetical protein
MLMARSGPWGLTPVHGAVAVGNTVEVGGDVEDLAWLGAPVEDVR